MLMVTGAEFAALCQAQLALLTQGLGATLGVVYLAQQLAEADEPHLVPVAVHPESGVDWEQLLSSVLSPETHAARQLPQSSEAARFEQRSLPPLSSPSWSSSENLDCNPPNEVGQRQAERYSQPAWSVATRQQLVLPLIHEEAVLGLLIVGRDDRPWNLSEQTQINQVVHTLTLGCILDQRYQWLSKEQQQQQVLEKQRRDLLDNLLHQLRNSLTTLQTFGKLILRRLLPGDTNQTVAASILREAERLRELALQLELATGDPQKLALLPLPASTQPSTVGAEVTVGSEGLGKRLAGGQPVGLLTSASLKLQPCSIQTVLEPLLASARAIAQDLNLQLHQRLSDHLPEIQVDVQTLHEVLNNLIENALKYTPSGGQILIWAEQITPQWLEIRVSDTGPGIPAADLPHIFERHYRGVQETSGIPGTGLGLAIAKTLVEQMQGEIQLVSPTRPSDWAGVLSKEQLSNIFGTTFIVKLPIAPALLKV